MDGAVWALVVFGVLLLIGAPIALSIPSKRTDWTGLAFEAFVIGLVVEMVVALALVHARWYNPFSALVLTVVIVGAATFAIRRFGGPRPDLAALRGREAVLIGAGAFVFVVAALAIRHAPSYFIFQTGDMGDYVNTANVFRQGIAPEAAQPQGFTVFLSGTNLLLGRSETVAGMPALGAALLLGAVAFARALRLHIAAAVGIAVILLVNPVAVWFSLLPVSEALSAVLFLALFYFVVRARQTRSMPYAAVGGVLAGSLLLVRGETMLLAPILVVVLLASVVVDDEPTVRVQKRFTYVALASLFAAYVYDVANAPVYFLDQLDKLLPDVVIDFVKDAHLERASVWLVLAGAVTFAAVVGLVRLVRLARPRVAGRDTMFWRCAYVAVIALAAIAALSYGLGGLRNTGQRWGVMLLVLVVVGAVAVAIRPGRYLDAVSGFLVFLVLGVFVVLFARRVPQPLAHTYYVYYDRYLFGEALPAVIAFAVVGIQVIVDQCLRAPTRAARVAVAAVLVVVVVGLVPQMRETRRITEHRLFGDSYDALERLDQLTRADGRPADIVYSGSRARLPGWFYPNTFRAFALPLSQSFERTVYGIPGKAVSRDLTYSPSHARSVLGRKNGSSGYLIQVRAPDEERLPADDHTKWVGTVPYTGPWLGQHPEGPAAPWRFARVDLDVYALNGENR